MATPPPATKTLQVNEHENESKRHKGNTIFARTKKRKKTRTKTKHQKMIIMQMPEIDAQDWEEYGDRQIKVNVGERGGQKEAYKE